MKNIVITALIVSAFGITLYMDTHNGQLPWDNSNSGRARYYNSYKVNHKYNKHYNNRYKRNRYTQKSKQYNRYTYSTERNDKNIQTYDRDPEFIRYRSELYMNLQDAWNLGKNINLPKAERTAIISVSIYNSGSRYIVLDKSSGSAEFDKAATEFVQNNINLIKPLPKNFNSDFLKIRIHLNKGTFGLSTTL